MDARGPVRAFGAGGRLGAATRYPGEERGGFARTGPRSQGMAVRGGAPASSTVSAAARRRRGTRCSRPDTAPPGCRISEPSAKSCARPWSARRSRTSRPTSKRGCSRFRTTWTACGASPDNHPERGEPRRACRQAADRRPRPVRNPRELRPPQQRPSPRVPRQVRLRLRVQERHRVLPVGRVRRDAPCRAPPPRRDRRRDRADARPRAARDLQPLPCPCAPGPDGCCSPGVAATDPGRGHDRLRGRGRREGRDPGHRRAVQAPVEGRLGDALGGARGRFTRCRART